MDKRYTEYLFSYQHIAASKMLTIVIGKINKE